MTVRLTAASFEDAAAITDLFLAARRAAMPYLPELHAEADVRRWMEAVVLRKSQVVLAVSPERLILGFAAVREGHLDHLYVAPAEQGRGVGTWLLAAAQANSPQGLRLFVFQRNLRARAFYERHGFRLLELRDGSQNEQREPDAVYEWRRSAARAPIHPRRKLH